MHSSGSDERRQLTGGSGRQAPKRRISRPTAISQDITSSRSPGWHGHEDSPPTVLESPSLEP